MSDQDNMPSPFRQYTDDPAYSAVALPEDDARRRRERIMATLRGRWHWAVILAVVLGVAGVLGGFFSEKELYMARSQFQIQPEVPTVVQRTSFDSEPPRFDNYLDVQLALLRSPVVQGVAADTPVWQDAIAGYEERPRFGGRLEAVRAPKSYIFQVSSEHETIELARASVDAMVEGFVKVFEERQHRQEGELITSLYDRKRKLENEIRQLNASRDAIAGDNLPGEMVIHFQAKMGERDRISRMLSDARLQLQLLQPETGKDPADLTIPDIMARDRRMRDMVMQHEALQAQIDYNRSIGIGDNQPSMRRSLEGLDGLWRRIEVYAEEYRAGFGESQVTGTSAGQQEVDTLRARINQLASTYDTLQAETASMSLLVNRIRSTSDEIASKEQELATTQARIEGLVSNRPISGRIEVMTKASGSPEPYNFGRRIKRAVMGGIGGGATGVMLVVFVGLMDRNLRSVSDAQMGVPNTRLLGMLPTLPEDMFDAEQGEMAANAVHHIRTMLQLGYENRCRVVSITSATAGSGKSSLTVALGLSFATSGSKVLLVDCDVVGGGLTRRLLGSAHEPKGLLDACAGQPLDKCVMQVGNKSVDVLPLGNANPHSAGLLSPRALRTLIAAARERYDFVIIDTGPVLGSLEASMAAPEVDGVVMVISRGDQKAAVSRSVEHIRALGANVAGLVFNHALEQDLVHSSYGSFVSQSRSVPGSRPQPASDAFNAARFGPLGSAVASFGGPTEAGGHIERASGAA